MAVAAVPVNKRNVGDCLPDKSKPEHLTEPELKRLKKVLDFSIDDPSAVLPLSKSLAAEMDWSDEFTRLAISEYLKFAFLASRQPGRVVPSIVIDTVWHMHLLYTRSYQSFCRNELEIDFLHHEPGRGDDAENKQFRELYLETLVEYEKYFGPPPAEVWGGDSATIARKFGLSQHI